MLKYCSTCGTTHDCLPDTSAPDPAVEIARINAERDKYIARVQRSTVREELETAEEIAETEAEASIVGDIASAEIIAGESAEGEAEAEGEPIVVQVPDAPAEPEPAAEEPPIIEPTTPKETKRGGYWANYR